MTITSCLRNGALRELFIEHLGWDRVRGHMAVEIDGDRFDLEQVAHKRGFLVVRLTINRARGQTKRLVRGVQVQVARVAHEHLLIVQDERSDVQVWAWAYRDGSNGRLKHRLHPLFTDRIPPRLVERIERLSVSLDEEERITLFDVVRRADEAMDAEADEKIFFRRPGYAQRSHELAIRMRAGGDREFEEFVLFHQKMATWFARRYRRLVNDEEAMVQEAMAGLIRAARKFDPDRGTAFSTYAFTGMRNECHRVLPRMVGLCRIPNHLYWPFRRVMHRWDRAAQTGGREAGLDARDQAILDEGLSDLIVVDLHRAISYISLDSLERGSERLGIAEYAHEIPEIGPVRTPLGDAMLAELRGILDRAVDGLSPDDAKIIRSRLLCDVEPKTLQQLGDEMGLTRERIRQREKRALAALRRWLLHEYHDDFAIWHTGDVADAEPDIDDEDAS